MLEIYNRVRLVTNRFKPEGAEQNAIGYIIEVYPNGKFEVEFSDADGITTAQIVAAESELEDAEDRTK